MNSAFGVANEETFSPSVAPAQNSSRRASSAVAIAFENLGVVYPARLRGESPKLALKNLNLRIEQGEVFGFLGPNGAGKTTTMNVLLGFVKPSSGGARIYGLDVTDTASRQKLGYLPELTYYYKFLTGRELLRFYAKLFDLPQSEAERRIRDLLKLVEIEHAADKPIRSYSKGMQQRIGLAQALINDPRLLVLDEPTSGLDPIGRMKVRSIIQRLKDEGKTVFFSSHELGEVETVCDRVAILNQGEVKEMGSVEDLIRSYNLNLEQIFLKVIGFDENGNALNVAA
ncbi:MAG TPA: ABC transporter ATP-binding protein [Verrucomicrobiae bacterium]|jgi:ABC-2 type transport system ATP-binding protein|nr:ABC transporter ATP-binding protein [Verrucomicrobiae bacterium]